MQHKRRFPWNKVCMAAAALAMILLTVVPVAAGPLYTWPTKTRQISSPYGPRKAPCSGCSTNHKGIDIPGPWGTPVFAARAGRVTFSGWKSGYGLVVYVQHPGQAETRYAHLNASYVKAGHKVRQGQVIGEIGSTGRGNGRPHLHFEIRERGHPLNPVWLLPR